VLVDDDSLPTPVADTDQMAAARARLCTKRLPDVPFIQDPPPNRFTVVHRLAAHIRQADQAKLRTGGLSASSRPRAYVPMRFSPRQAARRRRSLSRSADEHSLLRSRYCAASGDHPPHY
jgi:hypothetical protein